MSDRLGAAGVRLRDIGPRTFANLEARLRGTHLLDQELKVAFRQDGDLPIADHIHIGACCVEERILFGVAQAFVGGLYARLGCRDIVLGLKAVKQRLADFDPERTGCQPVGLPGGVVDVGHSRNRRPVAGLGDRHVLVSDANARAGRVQRRVVLVSLRQRAREGLGGNDNSRQRGR